MEIWLIVGLFASLILLLALGFPIAFSLAGISTIAALFLWEGFSGIFLVFGASYKMMTSFVLLAVPLFIFMAQVLRFSLLAEGLYEAAYRWLGALRGGLAMGTVLICAIFAAMVGISTVSVVTMGTIALPSMLEHKYDKRLAVGTICAGGALGVLIPPSIIMILYGEFADVSVGRLFIGGVIPGLILSGLFIVYIGVRTLIQPNLAPSAKGLFSYKEKFLSVKAVVLPALLILLVLGTIYLGVVTPTEAAGIGAMGALLCAAINRSLKWKMLRGSLVETIRLCGMIFWIIIGATAFSSVLTASGIMTVIVQVVGGLEINRWLILIAIQFVWFVLGMFLDPAGIILITTPIFVPIILELGFDPLWFGVLFVINMEMAYITPPFGFNLFVMRGVVPKGISMGDIYRSIVPFVGVQAVCLAICMIFPNIILYLPSTMIR